MEFKEELEIINSKYYNIIVQKYGHFVKNLSSKGNLTTNIIPLSVDDCKGRFADLIEHRARCDTNGKIYVRIDKFNEHVLVHEFIHRLTNNWKYLGGLRFGVIQGLNATHLNKHLFPYGYCRLAGLNELITEYLTYEITNYKESTPS